MLTKQVAIVVVIAGKKSILTKVKLCHHAQDAQIKHLKKKPLKTKNTLTKKVITTKRTTSQKRLQNLFFVAVGIDNTLFLI